MTPWRLKVRWFQCKCKHSVNLHMHEVFRPFSSFTNHKGSNFPDDTHRSVSSPQSPQLDLPPEPIPNRPLRSESRRPPYPSQSPRNRSPGYDFKRAGEENANRDQRNTKIGAEFLERFKLGLDQKQENTNSTKPAVPLSEGQGGGSTSVQDEVASPPPPPPEAEEIFKKMKETGLIPNAVAMLDGLCKDGLVQEAMKLFGVMREKGTIPEVVIYTAVVEGFIKAQKFDDALRIFRKMQGNGITPNAFSYSVLIQGLSGGKRLEEAYEFCLEMLEAGHSPNLATFTGLIDGFCHEKGLEEAKSVIGALKQKGFSYDEKAVREFLDKKGPFLPLVWEAILGKKVSVRHSLF